MASTRNYIEPRTALYVNWLLFREECLGNEFLDAFPRYQFKRRIERLRRERQLLTDKLEQKMRRGGYDLSRFDQKHRWTIARQYVEARDRIADLERYERCLDMAQSLADEWRDKL